MNVVMKVSALPLLGLCELAGPARSQLSANVTFLQRGRGRETPVYPLPFGAEGTSLGTQQFHLLEHRHSI